MRIAFCISGQPRTWKKCYQSWFDNLDHFGQDVDVFAHLWDFNTLPNTVPNARDLPATDLDDFVNTLKPKSIQIESKKNVKIIPNHKDIITNIFPPAVSQFYGVRKAAFLKRQYEIRHNFEYDLVFRLRADLLLENTVSIDNIDISPNSLYTCVNNFDNEFHDFRIGDIFYYGNSHAYDQASRFYDALSYIDASDVIQSTTMYPPEMAFYFYIKSIGLNNKPVFIDWKIMRPSYIVGFKELAPYEAV